jgi:hypothetical protein
VAARLELSYPAETEKAIRAYAEEAADA